jgi:cobalt/nickel transport system permease protein
MGITFIRGAEMSQEMYEAMCCRGFTDDYDRRLM